ncbi:glycosyltransferase family 4 protein [Pseudomonas coleopterorum]|uniref:glycosyltransferase family 4 protein n=1 Tax=Pseudomonas coleopterorum TaxID=1605838 RepID=UPI00177F7FE8|nr:glycosyltransferase family 1 protein [Pseudomonas coleopterorum]MBD8481806.1 glycosyltransferase family 4 protein [Pseudomonas coleopterorum]
MRIVIDMQGAQTGSRHRGIGRYTMALALAMVRNGTDHEFILALNGLFPDTIDAIRNAFDGLLPQENIKIWHSVGPVHAFDPSNDLRKDVAELIREEFIASLKPDIVHITSLMEGFGDNAVHSIRRAPFGAPCAVTFYDLIPLIQSEVYLKPNPDFERLYREKIAHLNKADLMLAISESSRQEALDHLEFSDCQVVNISAAVDDIFQPNVYSEKQTVILNSKYRVSKPYFMYSGATDDRKNHLGLISAYAQLPILFRHKYQLVLVGGLPDDHRYRFEQHIVKCGLTLSDVVITGRVTDDELVQFYNQCSLYIFASQHEGFGLPVLEAMSCGAPAIGANTTSIPEVIGFKEALFDPYSEQAIAEKIVEVINNPELYQAIREHGPVQARNFSWDISARRTLRAFEDWKAKSTVEIIPGDADRRAWLYNALARNFNTMADTEIKRIAQSIALHTPSPTRQLFVDVSEMVQRDSRTGVQRVVRSILRELIANPPIGYAVEPVYATDTEFGYRYARQYTQQFLGQTISGEPDPIIDFSQGDIFLGLDMQHRVQPHQATFYRHLRREGIKVYFVVYDLLPVLRPEFFPEGTFADHERWLKLAKDLDGFLCISRTVADELKAWLKEHVEDRPRPLSIEWFHIGADLENSNPTIGMPADADVVLSHIANSPSFLQVGTLEPRKGQYQTLKAFERLWAEDIDVVLVIVGKRGWNVDVLASELQMHPMAGSKLFWLDGISDEYLEKVYAASDCLIASSEGEGFGLPLIEAAQHGMPLIARKLPVFQEVAGSNAFYFEGLDVDSLANALRAWLSLFQRSEHPSSKALPWLTWAESAAQLQSRIIT